jgi:hypothetical protein
MGYHTAAEIPNYWRSEAAPENTGQGVPFG